LIKVSLLMKTIIGEFHLIFKNQTNENNI